MYRKGHKKTVLITGVTSDIGIKTALRFAEENWHIAGHYFSSGGKLEKLKKNIKNCGARSSFFKADLSLEKSVTDLVGKIKKLNIDSLINNAGTYLVNKDFTKLSVKDLVETFMVNIFAPVLISSAVFPNMKKRRFGRIVNISSIAAKYGGSNQSMHYGSSKLALEGVTKTLAKEGAKHNVLVNTIRPGVIDTGFHKKFPKDMKKRTAMIPLGRMGKPEDIADMIYFLGSEKNKFITNDTITISGGE